MRNGTLPWLRPDAKPADLRLRRHGKIRVDARGGVHPALRSHLPQRSGPVREEVIKPVLPADMINKNTRHFHQPDRAVLSSAAPWRLRSDRSQDHRRHLRRMAHVTVVALLRQGSVQGGPLAAHAATRYVAKNIVTREAGSRGSLKLSAPV